jgi:hypothetical protein
MKWLSILLFVAVGCAGLEAGTPVRRIPPRAVHAMMERGEPVLLVCAYEAKKCLGTHLAGSLTLEEFEKRRDTLAKDQRIVFYCG